MNFIRSALPVLAALAFALPVHADGDAWTVVGRQGILIHVIVPLDQSRDRDAYLRQVPIICGGQETCFVNFYTNSTRATPELPLPNAIASESTAVLRRSAKQGVDGLLWSCRMQMPEPDCF